MFRFPTAVPPRLSIELRAGTVTVGTAPTGETTVELAPLDDGAATAAAIAAATVDQRGDEIVVHVPHDVRAALGRAPRVAIRVTAPDGSALRVTSGSADVTARGRYGATTIDTGSGDVTVETVDGTARVNAGSGTVRIDHVSADAAVRTGSGDVHVDTVLGAATLTSGSGDVEVARGGRAVVAKTGSGDVTIGSAPPDLRITTASGNTRIDAVEEGEVRVKAASGDVQAAVRTGSAAWLDVHTVSGRVSSALDAGAAPGSGERAVRLQLSTVSGDIALTRV